MLTRSTLELERLQTSPGGIVMPPNHHPLKKISKFYPDPNQTEIIWHEAVYQLNHWTLLLLGDHLVLIYLTSSYYNQAAEAEAAREARAKVWHREIQKLLKSHTKKPRLSISPGDRSWGGTEGQQCSEAGSGGHSAISTCAAGQKRNIWKSMGKYFWYFSSGICRPWTRYLPSTTQPSYSPCRWPYRAWLEYQQKSPFFH